jgi:hypothetical protein
MYYIVIPAAGYVGRVNTYSSINTRVRGRLKKEAMTWIS